MIRSFLSRLVLTAVLIIGLCIGNCCDAAKVCARGMNDCEHNEIIAADALDESIRDIHLYSRINEEILKAMFPGELTVTFSDGSRHSVPVSWESPEDYSEGRVYYYVYDPVIKDHEISPDAVLPYIVVWIDEPCVSELPATVLREDTTGVEPGESQDSTYHLQDLVRLVTVDRDANEREIYEYLRNELGLNEAAAAGVLANINAESGFRQNALGDKNSEGYYTSYGLCQWHNSRWENLIWFCVEKEEDWQTVHGQMMYLQNELEHGYRSVLNTLRTVENSEQGAYEAAYAFCYRFEIPANREATADSRGRVAKDRFWPRYKPEEQPDEDTYMLYRLYNPNSGEHFYTGSTEERENLVTAGWNFEGNGWEAPRYSGAAVYRLYNPNAGDHHYTMSEEEKDHLARLGWQYEGIAWNSADPSAGKPLYRLYNPNAEAGAHHYTLSTEEKDNLVSLGWKYEGIGWYGI